MNYKNPDTDSGNYVDGVYTTKNGFNTSGLNCPKGTRLYNPNITQAVWFLPDDIQPGEDFKIITDDVAKDILPYYAISNYGRVFNIWSNKILKPNYKPNGYEYYCLSAFNCKYGQKKYMTHRLVMGTFYPIPNMDLYQVNHINANKSDNYINKLMPDGSIISNLEWVTCKQNIDHIHKMFDDISSGKITYEMVITIRKMHDEGYSYEQIMNNGFNFVTFNTIQNICQNTIFVDPDYTPKTYEDSYKLNPANLHRITDSEAEHIRYLNSLGYSYDYIRNTYYPEFSICTMSDICRYKTHNR